MIGHTLSGYLLSGRASARQVKQVIRTAPLYIGNVRLNALPTFSIRGIWYGRKYLDHDNALMIGLLPTGVLLYNDRDIYRISSKARRAIVDWVNTFSIPTNRGYVLEGTSFDVRRVVVDEFNIGTKGYAQGNGFVSHLARNLLSVY